MVPALSSRSREALLPNSILGAGIPVYCFTLPIPAESSGEGGNMASNVLPGFEFGKSAPRLLGKEVRGTILGKKKGRNFFCCSRIDFHHTPPHTPPTFDFPLPEQREHPRIFPLVSLPSHGGRLTTSAACVAQLRAPAGFRNSMRPSSSRADIGLPIASWTTTRGELTERTKKRGPTLASVRQAHAISLKRGKMRRPR